MTGNSKTSDSRIIISREARNLCYSRRGTHVSPHMCCELLHFPHLSFIPLGPYPARFARHLFFPAGKAVFSFRCLPNGGRRYSHYPPLRRISPLSFIPPVPYPPLRGTFPSRGRLTIRGKPAIADLRASPHIYLRRSRHHKFESRLFLLPIYEAS